jgi:hypothetical protein
MSPGDASLMALCNAAIELTLIVVADSVPGLKVIKRKRISHWLVIMALHKHLLFDKIGNIRILVVVFILSRFHIIYC